MFYQFAPRFPGPEHIIHETPQQICRRIDRSEGPRIFFSNAYLFDTKPTRVSQAGECFDGRSGGTDGNRPLAEWLGASDAWSSKP